MCVYIYIYIYIYAGVWQPERPLALDEVGVRVRLCRFTVYTVSRRMS